MIVDVPNTTSNALVKALTDLRKRNGANALSRVLNLVVVVNDEMMEEAIESANKASYEHPCRVIVVVLGESRGTPKLDGQIRVGGDAGASEVLVLKAYGPLTKQAASLVTPLLLSDAPVVAWWPGESPRVPSEDPVGRMATRRITDAAACARPSAALKGRVTGYRAGDTDLAWSRITRWRALTASAMDQRIGQNPIAARVVGAADSPSADLLAGWLAEALQITVKREKPDNVEGLRSVHIQFDDGWLELVRPDDDDTAELTFPGRPPRPVSLPRRGDAECLAEELRRLDPDDIYADVLLDGLPRLRSTRKVTA